MNESHYTLRVRHDDDSYWATIDELPGLFASGLTLDDLRECVSESIPLYLSDGAAPVVPVAVSSDLQVGAMRITVAA